MRRDNNKIKIVTKLDFVIKLLKLAFFFNINFDKYVIIWI